MSSSWRGRLLLLFLLVWIAGFCIYFFWPETVVRHPPGILVAEEPVQRPTTATGWESRGYHFTPLAEFEATAVILHLKRYHSGRESDLSPVDLALGWGPMSDQSIIDRLEISQSRRWYEYKAKVLPLPHKVISSSSSNMHMIPANGEIRKRLLAVRQGELISLGGYLVGVQEDGRWIWFSSLSRTDSGDGACEIVWVEDVIIH